MVNWVIEWLLLPVFLEKSDAKVSDRVRRHSVTLIKINVNRIACSLQAWTLRGKMLRKGTLAITTNLSCFRLTFSVSCNNKNKKWRWFQLGTKSNYPIMIQSPTTYTWNALANHVDHAQTSDEFLFNIHKKCTFASSCSNLEISCLLDVWKKIQNTLIFKL